MRHRGQPVIKSEERIERHQSLVIKTARILVRQFLVHAWPSSAVLRWTCEQVDDLILGKVCLSGTHRQNVIASEVRAASKSCTDELIQMNGCNQVLPRRIQLRLWNLALPGEDLPEAYIA